MGSTISPFSILLLLGSAQGFFLALALFNARGGNRIAHRLLALLTFIFALELGSESLNQIHFFAQASFLVGVDRPLKLLYGPLIFLYVSALTAPTQIRWTGKRWLHFLPFVAGYVLLTPMFALDADIKPKVLYAQVDIDRWQLVWALLGDAIITLVSIVQIGIYLGLAFRRLFRHARQIRDQFSYTERISLTWVRNLLIVWSGLYLIYFIDTFLPPALDLDEAVSDLLMLMIVIMIYTMGFLGLRQPVIFARRGGENRNATPQAESEAPLQAIQHAAVSDEKYKKSALNAEMSETLLAELLAHMDIHKPYLDGGLTLPQLAEQLGLSPNYLSQVINERLEQNFFDFINRYRIEEAKRCLANPVRERDNIITLALDAGFNSKSAFYTAFKKHTAMTPSQYKKSLPVS
jgi:AraC-like DNA-binding protein